MNDDRSQRALALLAAVELLDTWQVEMSIMNILDEWRGYAGYAFAKAERLPDALIELAKQVEEQST